MVIPDSSIPVVKVTNLNIGYQNRIVCENLNFEIRSANEDNLGLEASLQLFDAEDS